MGYYNQPDHQAREKIRRIGAPFISQILPEMRSCDLVTLPYKSKMLVSLLPFLSTKFNEPSLSVNGFQQVETPFAR